MVRNHVRTDGGFALIWPEGVRLRRIAGANLGVTETEPLANGVPAQANQAFQVTLATPRRPGRYTSLWRVFSAEGHPFGDLLWCSVEVTFPYNDELVNLLEMFPEAPVDQLRALLIEHHGDINEIIPSLVSS